MDDTCAVCAEVLKWAAYGQCGHREVCSTCIARLRFICDDRRCCICKTKSNIIFVTKALGDFTTMIKDFSIFPVDSTEGQVGPYWYHEGTQAFFDDLDHYKMIAAMCKLSCVVCDKKDEQGKGKKRREKFRNIEQLKSHLFHHHRLFMCSLCLEGRKKFMCEQKLYTRAQLNQHINTGDSEVDGSESERGGFMGHPLCEFCRNPFYGDNELYSHMCTKHYTCHICQRLHPGQYDYYRDYDDLEIHFRGEHFLCEDKACLAEKFVVFATESEMKRHNVMEHGGHMSRSKRNAALQIPISFQYRRREQDQNVRRHGFNHDYSDGRLSLAILASLETENAYAPRAISSRAQTDSDHRETSEIDTTSGSFESFVSADSEHYSRIHHAEGNSRNSPLEESSFPPLPVAARSSHQKPKNGSCGLGRNTMVAQLRHRNSVTVLNVSQARPASSHRPTPLIGGSSQLRPISNSELVLSSGFACSSSSTPAKINGLAPSNTSSFTQIGSTSVGPSTSSASSLTKSRSSSKVSHCASTSKLVDRGSSESAVSNFPPLSAMHSKKSTTNTQALPKVEDVNAANKSLVERIRADLEFDADKYAAFKDISSEYRRGLVDPWEYLSYVHQFGLSHLVLELARLCPDAQKQKELVEAYHSSLRGNGPLENIRIDTSSQLKHQKSSRKGKEKSEGYGISSSNGALADSVITSVRELQLNCKHSEEVEVLSKDGYRSTKGKPKVLADDEQAGLNSGTQPHRVNNNSQSAAADVSNRTIGTKEGGNKPRKKTSKFLRVRLGESSLEAAPNLTNSDPGPDLTKVKSDGNTDASDGLPVRGAWHNGGGQKLVANWR